MAYKIVGITPMVDIDERGRFYKIYRVKFTVDEQIEDFIDIPEKEFSEAEARKRVEARASEIERLMKG